MSALRIIGMVALFTIGGELPALAQAAVQEPGAYAFYHPDADVLNAGRPAFRAFDPMGPFASDRGFRSDAYAPTLRTPSRRHHK
jgi:hypothetical protein